MWVLSPGFETSEDGGLAFCLTWQSEGTSSISTALSFSSFPNLPVFSFFNKV